MIRLVQLIDEDGARRVAVSNADANALRLIDSYLSVYDLARAAIRAGAAALVCSHGEASDDRDPRADARTGRRGREPERAIHRAANAPASE